MELEKSSTYSRLYVAGEPFHVIVDKAGKIRRFVVRWEDLREDVVRLYLATTQEVVPLLSESERKCNLYLLEKDLSKFRETVEGNAKVSGQSPEDVERIVRRHRSRLEKYSWLINAIVIFKKEFL